MRTPIDTTIFNDIRTTPNSDTYLQHMLSKIELTREIAKQNIQDCNSDTQFYYDRNAAYPTDTVGQRVLLYDPVTKNGICKKLRIRWTGPFFITATGDGYVYKLRRCHNGQEHSNRLRLFHDSRDLLYTRNPPSTEPDTTADTSTPQNQVAQTDDTNPPTSNLDDGWYEIDKVTSRKPIAGKPHFLVHWKDGSKSYEPDENISDYAKTMYYARCQARRKQKGRTHGT